MRINIFNELEEIRTTRFERQCTRSKANWIDQEKKQFKIVNFE